MKVHPLGRTGVEVSQIGLGSCFMRAQGQPAVDDCFARAIDRGISYVDTAADYGGGDDERMLGIALRDRWKKMFIATKVGGVEETGGHRSAEALMRQFEEGLQRLQTDCVDLIQIHESDQRKWWSDDPVLHEDELSHAGPLIRDDEEYDFANSPCVQFLRRAKEQGKARFIGITGKDARRLARLVEALDLDSMLVAHQHNPIYRNASRFLLPLTTLRGIGVAGGAMLMKGWLAAPKTEWCHEPPPWMDEAFRHAYFSYLDIQDTSGIPLHELTIRWLLAEKRIHSIVLGFSSWSEIDMNLDAVSRGPLPADLQTGIDAIGIVHPLIYQGRSEL